MDKLLCFTKGLPTLRVSDVQGAKVNFGLTWQRTCSARGAYRSLGNRKAWVPPSCSRKSYPLGEEKSLAAPQTLPLIHSQDETEPGAETDSTNTDIRHPFHLWSDLGIPVPHNPSPPWVSRGLLSHTLSHTHTHTLAKRKSAQQGRLTVLKYCVTADPERENGVLAEARALLHCRSRRRRWFWQ